MLRDLLLLASTFTGATMALTLEDEAGVFYRDSSGLTNDQLAALDPARALEAGPETRSRMARELGFHRIEVLPLEDGDRHPLGFLWTLLPPALTLSPGQGAGLELVARQVQAILTMDQQKRELRATPRAPSAASFVPGLVHELRNFVFGISANLDAFQARFADEEELGRYGATIRKGMDRLSGFIAEMQEYADPQALTWTESALEPLLRDASEQLKPLLTRNQIELKIHGAATLPALCLDEERLRGAFIHLIGLAIQQEASGGHVDLQLATRAFGERVVICGHLDGSCLKLRDVDLARLFEPFYFRGAGLGRLALPAARRVFEAHGGSLTAGPGPEGGMRISFTLPAVMTYPLQSASQP